MNDVSSVIAVKPLPKGKKSQRYQSGVKTEDVSRFYSARTTSAWTESLCSLTAVVSVTFWIKVVEQQAEWQEDRYKLTPLGYSTVTKKNTVEKFSFCVPIHVNGKPYICQTVREEQLLDVPATILTCKSWSIVLFVIVLAWNWITLIQNTQNFKYLPHLNMFKM